MNNVIEQINSALMNIKMLRDHDVISRNSDTRDISIKLNAELKEIQDIIFQLIHENTGLKKEIRELKIRLGDEKEFEVKNSVYYSPDGDGPFCPFCLDKRGRKNRLRSDVSEKCGTVIYACRVCGGSFGE